MSEKKYWTTEAPKVDKLVPRGDIGWLINRLHVSTPDSEIGSDMRNRCANQPGWTPELIEQAVAYALWCHAENRAMCQAVMRGNVA